MGCFPITQPSNYFQQRIAQKEETLRKFEELLRQARDDMASANQRHEHELRVLQVRAFVRRVCSA